MNILTWVVTFAVIMGVVAFLAGLVNALRLLRQAAGGGAAPPPGTQLGAVLLVGIGGALVGTAMVTAALVTERETDLVNLKSSLDFLEAKVRVYETGLGRLERTLEGAKGSRVNADRLVVELKQEVADLRLKRASLR